MSELLFVYNANSGIGNLVLDVAHKLFRPETYTCNLCAITHNTFSENKIWKAFRAHSVIDMDFLHIDEFKAQYPNTHFKFPIILQQDNNVLTPLLTTEAINKLTSVDDLITSIKTHF